MAELRKLMAELSLLPDHFRDKTRMVIGSAMYPRQTYRWLHFLKLHQVLWNTAIYQPSLMSKIYRPYLSQATSCKERVELLIAHYSFLLESCYSKLVLRAALRPVTLATFHGRSGTCYRLELSTLDRCRREGELILQLRADGEWVYTAVFLFVVEQGKPQVKLGALRGMLPTDASGSIGGIKQVTRDLHGCRPRDLMVDTVRTIGAHFGCTKTILISNRSRLAVTGTRVCRKSQDYDRIWLEMGAVVRADGDFELPGLDTAAIGGIGAIGATAATAAAAAQTTMRKQLRDAVTAAVASRLAKEKSSTRYLFGIAATSPRRSIGIQEQRVD